MMTEPPPRPARPWLLPLVATIVLAAALVAVGLVRNREAPAGAWVGERAPRWTLPLVAEPGAPAEQVAVVDGEPTLVFFWGPSCVVCKTVSPAIDGLARAEDPGVRVLTVSGEDAADIRSYVSARRYVYPVLHDADYGLHGAWGVGSIPRTVVIDREGVVRFDRVGTLTTSELEAAVASVR